MYISYHEAYKNNETVRTNQALLRMVQAGVEITPDTLTALTPVFVLGLASLVYGKIKVTRTGVTYLRQTPADLEVKL